MVIEASATVGHEIANSALLDAVVVLGAKAEKGPNGWVLPEIIESEPGKVVGGESRARAAVQAYREKLAGVFLLTGGYETEGNGRRISRAQIMEDTMRSYGLDNEAVIYRIGQGGNTQGNKADVIAFLKHHPEVIREGRLGILTNRYHMDRALLLFQDQWFEDNAIQLIPLIAEDLQVRYDPDNYADWELGFNQTPAMEERLALERQGVLDFLSGRYVSNK